MSVEVNEGTTPRLTGTVKDAAGAAIPGSSLTTFVVTLYDRASATIINSRNKFDLKANVDPSGVLTWDMAAADNSILDDSRTGEIHVALFEWTYPTNKAGKAEVSITVRNISKVP